VTEWTAQYSI